MIKRINKDWATNPEERRELFNYSMSYMREHGSIGIIRIHDDDTGYGGYTLCRLVSVDKKKNRFVIEPCHGIPGL